MLRRLLLSVACITAANASARLAHSADIVVPANTVSNTARTVTSGDTLTVETGATLSTSGNTQAVTITGTSGTVTVTNAGTIAQTGTARAMRNNTNGVTLILNNTATGAVTAVGDDVLKIGQPASGYRIDNQGMLHQVGVGTASGQALDLRDVQTSVGNTIVNGSATNTAATIRADGDDALRPGANTSIVNYGTIVSNGVVDTKCPDYLGAACNGKPSAHDAIDIGGRTGVSIENYGAITGPRHAITADTDVFVLNRAGGLIVGRNGSGVGSDGSGTVINYGTIRGEYAGAGNVYEHVGGGGVTTASNGDGDGVDIDGVARIENYGVIIGAGAGGVDNGNNPNGSDAIAAGGGVIINAAGALIRGQTNGVLVDDGSAGPGVAMTSIVNEGAIEGVTGYGVRIRGGFDNTIVNAGVISGGVAAVETGTGADTLDMRLGARLVGRTDLGGGADRLLIEGGSYTLAFTQTSGLTVSAPGVVAIGADRVVVVDRNALPQSSAFLMAGAALDMTSWRADARMDPRSPAGWQGWARGFAYAYQGDRDGAKPSWDMRMSGLAAGVDTRVDATLLFGAYIAAGRSDFESAPQDTDSSNVFGGVYGRWTPGAMFLDAGLTFGASRDEGRRIVFDSMAAGGVETARLNRKGVFLSPHVGVGAHYVYEGMTITPALRLRYMAHFLDGARESATNGLVLDDATLGLFEARAELAVARRFDSGFTLRAKIGTIYDTQVSGDRNAATVAGLRLSLPQDVRGLGAGAFGSVGFAFEAGPGALVFAEAEGVAKSNGVTGFGGRAGVQIRF